jgi:REP element-mobilizing transposase RayT|tara:strand:+ start:324 stop:539 length:216 start_codon:yes stop_codon:yes gene_type:complete
MQKAEIHVVVTTGGFERTEVLAPKSNPEVKDLIMQTYSQIAFEIYKFRRQVNQILDCSEEEAEKKGFCIYS